TSFSRDWSSDVCSSDLLVGREVVQCDLALDGLEVARGVRRAELTRDLGADDQLAGRGLLARGPLRDVDGGLVDGDTFGLLVGARSEEGRVGQWVARGRA